MIVYDWVKVFNRTEFIAEDIPSKEYTADYEGLGRKTILVTMGIGVSMLYEGIFLPINLNSKNPFEFEDHAIYLDENEDVWLGTNPHEDDDE